MTITLNGTTGIVGPNGTASAPAMTGTDTDTGIVYGTNTVQIATGGTAAVTVNSSQNVGIGVSSPSAKLDVSGQILTGSTGNNAVAINASGVNYGFISNPSTGLWALGYGTTIGTLGTSSLTWDSSSRVGINSNPAAYIGNEQFFVAGTNTAGQYVSTIAHTATSPSGGCVSFLSYTGSAPNNTSNSFLICNDNTGVQKLNIYSNGTVSNRTGTYNTLSDAKLKENIEDATPKLDKLMQVKVRNYNLIGDELKQIGFVAQELEQVFPSLVEDVPDFDKDNQLTGESTKMVKSSVLVPILVKAMQEQQAIITDLKARIETLENK